MVEKYKNFNDIFPDTNIITGIDESQGPYTSGEEIFGEELTPSTDAALAKYAYGDPDMEIGEESLLDPKLRGRISAADTIKNIFGGEALDMDFMGQQVGDIVSEINKGEKMDKEALGQMISEFDDQGLGVKIEDLIRQFDPSITAKELRGVLTDVVKVGLGGAETAAGKKLTGAMMPDYLKDKGIDTTDLDTKLREEAKAIEQRLATTKTNIENLLNDEEAGEFAQSVIDAKNAMQQLAENAEESIKPITMGVQKTETIAGLISINNQTILDAEEAIKTAQGLIRDAQAELDRAKGK